MARVHVLERRQRLDLPIDEVFAFYGDAHNLERITPPLLGFEVITPRPIEMGPGTLIEYRLRLHGVPVRWRTRIEVWEPPRRFVDVQLRGPYSLWEHARIRGGRLWRDDHPRPGPLFDSVRAAGRAGGPGLVRRDLKRIFDYRRDAVARELGHG